MMAFSPRPAHAILVERGPFPNDQISFNCLRDCVIKMQTFTVDKGQLDDHEYIFFFRFEPCIA